MSLNNPTARSGQRQRGFVLMALLIVFALGGVSLMAAVDVWTLEAQRERERQLLFAGDQYRLAIQSYYYSAPNGAPKQLPLNFQVLLEDDRYPVPVRHLRRLYPDPVGGGEAWGLIKSGERIAGVFSRSEARPIKQTGFPPFYDSFTDQSRYLDWAFVFSAAPGLRNRDKPAEDPDGLETPAFTTSTATGRSP